MVTAGSSIRVGAVVRHATPHLFEATLIPMGVFYCFFWLAGIWTALLMALVWDCAMLGRRKLAGEAMSGMLILGTVALVGRTVAALISGSVFVYFLGPILTTVIAGGVFVVSAATPRPLAGRLATELLPLSEEVRADPEMRRFFRRASLLWGVEYLANAGLTLGLLLTQPVPVYVAAHTFGCWGLSLITFAISALWLRRVLARTAAGATMTDRRELPLPSIPAVVDLPLALA